MYCKACGKQIPDDSAFCMRCGTPQGASVERVESAPRWEECELKVVMVKNSFFGPSTLSFHVVGTGPKGQFSQTLPHPFTTKHWGSEGAARPGDLVVLLAGTNGYSGRVSPEMQAAFDDAVRTLTRSGWDRYGRWGSEWYQIRFRRKAEG
jgi:hypothetical protein